MRMFGQRLLSSPRERSAATNPRRPWIRRFQHPPGGVNVGGMYGMNDDGPQGLRHDLGEAYGNMRVSVLAMETEREPQARLGWLVLMERSAARLEQVLADAERREEGARQRRAAAAAPVPRAR